MKFTWRNNPISWLLGFVLFLVIGLLLLNLIVRKPAVRGIPPTTSMQLTDEELMREDAPDSITVIASDRFEATDMQRWLYGRMYREAWSSPVKVPVLRLDTFAGGLTLIKLGGGFQTVSLDLQDSSGQVYTLRTVNKNPDKLIPAWAPALGIDNIVTDGISAGHPYGAMVAATLADLAGLKHMHPTLYYVPRQITLARFVEKEYSRKQNAASEPPATQLGQQLMWLEFEPDDDVAPWLNLDSFVKWRDSEDVFERWVKENGATNTSSKGVFPDLQMLVRARLFDIWVGDWDRHDGQWGWAEYIDQGKTRFLPVPNDRDNIFYGISGVIPLTIAAFERRLRPFGPRIDDIRGLTKNSAPFDGAFLYTVPESVFLEEARSLQQILTDDGIEKALKIWPKAIYDLDGERILEDLKTRRDELPKYAKKFHKVIQSRGPSTTVENDF